MGFARLPAIAAALWLFACSGNVDESANSGSTKPPKRLMSAPLQRSQ